MFLQYVGNKHKEKTHIHNSNINTKESVNMTVILTTSAFRINLLIVTNFIYSKYFGGL